MKHLSYIFLNILSANFSKPTTSDCLNLSINYFSLYPLTLVCVFFLFGVLCSCFFLSLSGPVLFFCVVLLISFYVYLATVLSHLLVFSQSWFSTILDGSSIFKFFGSLFSGLLSLCPTSIPLMFLSPISLLALFLEDLLAICSGLP